jgi:peptide/nickel transport system substrate-binding protein
MKNSFRIMVILGFVIVSSGLITGRAQGGLDDPGAGKGAALVEPNFGGDVETLNPILVNTGTAATVSAAMFPFFVALNPETGLPKAGLPNSLVTGWESSMDGLVYTFTLRTDMKWSDGTPITSADVKYAYDAVVSGDVDTPLTSQIASIASLEAPDAATVVITYKDADCAAVQIANNLVVVPSHIFKKVYPTFKDMTTSNAYNLNPEAAAGPFVFANFRAGEQLTLKANTSYPDSPVGHVIPEGFVIKQLADQTVGVEQFLNGQISYISSVPEARQDEMEALAAEGKHKYGEGPAVTFQYLFLNLADPANPKSAVDADGKPQDQGHHPIMGDVRVRQAMALGIDHDALNKGAFNGHGVPHGSPLLPHSWAFNSDVKPWPFDQERAMKLLDEAGFVKDANNPDGPRIANDKALYAKPGTVLEYTLTAFSGNASVEASSVLIQDQLKKIGFKVNVETIEFQAMVAKLLGQNFDAVMVFFSLDPNNPHDIFNLYDPSGDVVDSGFGVMSYNNPEVSELMTKARTLPGCDVAERKKLYDRVQVIIHDELPNLFINWSQVPYVWQNELKNFEPLPFGFRHNRSAWFWAAKQ